MADHTIYFGNVEDVLASLAAESVDTVCTSPPYFKLRRYSDDAREIGREATPEEYVERLVGVFREVRRVLKPTGTVWLNLGDSYAAGRVGRADKLDGGGLYDGPVRAWQGQETQTRKAPPGLRPKDLLGIPWLVAFALRADGWWLRNDIAWTKPNAMPESVRDRFSSKYEHVFLLLRVGYDYCRHPTHGPPQHRY